jgi:energy-coupling factor transport system substrate-specific component
MGGGTWIEVPCRGSRTVATVGMMTALSVAMRVVKHLIIGAVQVINFPFMFTLIASSISPCAGLLTGIMSYAVSDVLFGIGPWTAVNSALCGIIGLIWGYIRTERRELLFLLSFLSEFIFDIANSSILYMLFGLSPIQALIVGLIGLFLPVMGGSIFLIGPMTEVTTSLGVALIRPKLRSILREG